MASTSSSSTQPSNQTHMYDVFLSFRGEDTGCSFTDHLYHALLRARHRTYRDNYGIDRGEELKPEIKTAIMESKVSIIVLSKNYASSTRCLDELGFIMEQRRVCNHVVLPVFYHVEPSDVRNQRKCFTVDDVTLWKEALREVGNLSGVVVSSSRSETNFIAEVIETVSFSLPVRYDVFVSFRGHDTRQAFTDHLFKALLREGLYAFIDTDAIQRGQELKQEIITAIMEARAYIVVLSKNYATSTWCLDELCLIMEKKRKCGHFILPIFYHVDPSEFRKQRGSFSTKRSRTVDEDEDEVRQRREALTNVADLTGMVARGYETDFIADVVDIVKRNQSY